MLGSFDTGLCRAFGKSNRVCRAVSLANVRHQVLAQGNRRRAQDIFHFSRGDEVAQMTQFHHLSACL